MATAAVTFHVTDPETSRRRVFYPGDEVPEHILSLVGDHCISDGPSPVVDEEPADADVDDENEDDEDDPDLSNLDDEDDDEEPVDLFDPAKAKDIAEVLRHLEASDEAEYARVIAAEKAGKNRKGIVGSDD